jgi:TATA-binding protein-associated factor Taf7
MENNVDFMTFINKMNKISKKKSKGIVIKEEENSDSVDENEIVTNKDIGEEDSETKDMSDKKSESTSTEEDADEDDEDDEDEDDDDDDDDDDEDDDEDDDDDDDNNLTEDKLYNLLNTFFIDEYGVTVATSMSNIAYELHKLNSNIGKYLKK